MTNPRRCLPRRQQEKTYSLSHRCQIASSYSKGSVRRGNRPRSLSVAHGHGRATASTADSTCPRSSQMLNFLGRFFGTLSLLDEIFGAGGEKLKSCGWRVYFLRDTYRTAYNEVCPCNPATSLTHNTRYRQSESTNGHTVYAPTALGGCTPFIGTGLALVLLLGGHCQLVTHNAFRLPCFVAGSAV
jgi:hypothetical protein